MRFSLPLLFGERSFDYYADIEARLETLTTQAAMRGIQSLVKTVPGPIIIPDVGTYTNLMTITSDELTIPRDDSLAVVTYQMDIAISGATNPIRGLEGRLNGSLWGGITFTETSTANFASKTFYARPDYGDTTNPALPAWATPSEYAIPLVYLPGATGPYGLTLDVRRDLTGWGGTVTVRNLEFSIDVL